MKAIRHFSTDYRAALTLAPLLILTLGTLAMPASAQPSAPDEDVGARLVEMEQSLTQPGIRLQMTQAQWDAYGDNLEKALATGHEGVQQGALRMLILYADNLTISRTAVHDVVRLYRDHPDDQMRRMAVVALGKIQDPWGLDFLKRSVRFEASPGVRHTLKAVLADTGTIEPGPAKVGS